MSARSDESNDLGGVANTCSGLGRSALAYLRGRAVDRNLLTDRPTDRRGDGSTSYVFFLRLDLRLLLSTFFGLAFAHSVTTTFVFWLITAPF